MQWHTSLFFTFSLSLPAIPVQGATPSGNTTRAQYPLPPPEEIPDVMTWPEFNYAAIIQRYGPLLNETEVERIPFGTPPHPIRSEGAFQGHFL